MRPNNAVLAVALLAFATAGMTQDRKPRSDSDASKVVKDTVKGSIHHGSGGSVDRIVGPVKVIDANTLAFADGTRVALDMVAPDPGQLGKIDGKLYPCGREAAEFLRQRIGDRPVTVFDYKGNPRAYLGDDNLKHTMAIHGWALADHSSLHAAEIIARESKRGLWRGEFVDPAEWRNGKRLPGEEAARKQANEQKPGAKPAAIVGAWEVTSYHTTQAGLFQLEWGARRREAKVRIEQAGDRFTGHVVSTERGGVKGEPIVFRTLRFSGDRLVFEYDIKWEPGYGPLAVESRRLPNKGTLRAEARLTDDRLVGTWGLFTVDGAEVFRGEWEAVRAKAIEKPMEPLPSRYKVGEQVPLLWEYRVTGPRAGQDGALLCTYIYQPFVAVYCRDITPPVVRLIKQLDQETAKYSTRPLPASRERLGSYVVLICDTKAREQELKALAEKEKIQHTILALGAKNEGLPSNEAYWRTFDAGLGEAETTVLLAGPPRALIRAAYAFRRGELNDNEVERVIADLSKLVPQKK